ncbi:MAG: FHA domain-containing protein [Chitinophagales bacterium]|nr:FHA domain-containing protein [Chitinophagales bacterium]
MTVKVGNASNHANHIKIHDDSVSREHLQIEKLDNETLLITDLNSTNGTFIDDIQIRESRFQRHQTIRIGHQKFTGDQLFDKLRMHFLDSKVIWVDEFSRLKNKFSDYEKEKAKIIQSYQTKLVVIRAVVLIMIWIVLFFIGGEIGIQAEFRHVVSIIGGVLAMLIIPKLLPNERRTEELSQLRKKYSKMLACPRCSRDLSAQPYTYWIEQRSCQQCHAVWAN